MKNETTVLTAKEDRQNKDVEKRLTRLEAAVRMIMNKAEIHWGKDVDGDGVVGSIAVKLIGIMAAAICCGSAMLAFAGDTVVDFTSGQTAYSGATAKIDITPGGTATMVVDQVNATILQATYTNGSWTGTTTLKGTVNLTGSTNTLSGPTTISGATTASGGGTWLGRKVLLSVDGTTQKSTESGTIVCNSLGGGTGTFTTAFHSGTTPIILIQPQNTCTTNPYPAPGLIVSNKFVIVGDALTTNAWFAIGQKQ